MIVEAILGLLKTFLLFIIGLFPALPDMSGFFTYLTPLSNVINKVGMFIDLSVFSACMAIIFIVYNARALWALVMWVVRKIPGVS